MHRLALILVVLAACDTRVTHTPSAPTPIDAAIDADYTVPNCIDPAPAGSCSCSYVGSGWRWTCNTCPFFEGSDPVPCTTPGAGCEIETWEHDCPCTCLASGWWQCANETVGTHCPQPPPADAGVD